MENANSHSKIISLLSFIDRTKKAGNLKTMKQCRIRRIRIDIKEFIKISAHLNFNKYSEKLNVSS